MTAEAREGTAEGRRARRRARSAAGALALRRGRRAHAPVGASADGCGCAEGQWRTRAACNLAMGQPHVTPLSDLSPSPRASATESERVYRRHRTYWSGVGRGAFIPGEASPRGTGWTQSSSDRVLCDE